MQTSMRSCAWIVTRVAIQGATAFQSVRIVVTHVLWKSRHRTVEAPLLYGRYAVYAQLRINSFVHIFSVSSKSDVGSGPRVALFIITERGLPT